MGAQKAQLWFCLCWRIIKKIIFLELNDINRFTDLFDRILEKN
jgi:hypothetical protein